MKLQLISYIYIYVSNFKYSIFAQGVEIRMASCSTHLTFFHANELCIKNK
jgi:hypothetical protein